MATYDLTQAIPSVIKTGDILNCPYSGRGISLVLPSGSYKLECWGAQGGYRSSITYGGKGGYAAGTLALSSRRSIYLYTGGSGNYGSSFNGGGRRTTYNGGGGASDIRLGTDSLYARVIVAGGGGSDGASSKPGKYGGGLVGGDATESYGSIGYGGTQTGVSGGSAYITTKQSTGVTSKSDTYAGFGFGGNGIEISSGYGGAGGGGWYGGCGSCPDGSGDDDRGGGGGSGYVYTISSAVNYPAGCLLTERDYLNDTSLIDGNTAFLSPDGTSVTGREGDGYIRITVLNVITSFVKNNSSTWSALSSIFTKQPNTPILASQVAIGDKIWLNVNNVPTEFIVVHQGNPDNTIYNNSTYSSSFDGTWVLMKNIYTTAAWSTDSYYNNSTLQTLLNTTFLNTLDSDIQSAILTTAILYDPQPYYKYTHNAQTYIGKIFLPSTEEILGHTIHHKTAATLGAQWDYFKNGGNIDADQVYWSRSVLQDSNNGNYDQIIILSSSYMGNWAYGSPTASRGIRPAFILNPSTSVNTTLPWKPINKGYTKTSSGWKQIF